jgi:DNA-binding CsgD family transcriptional regulator
VDAFALIAAGEDPSERMPDAVAELLELGLVVRDVREGHRLVPLNPRDVLRRRMMIEFGALDDCLSRMRSLPGTVLALEDAFERSQLHAGGRSEFIPDPVVVNARLQDVVGGAQFEILAAQPAGPRTKEHLEAGRGRDTDALERGVTLRTLYRATVRDNPVTAEHARMMANRPDGRSAEFRTLAEPFERAIIVDRRTAFISNTVVPGAHENSAWQITDGAFVAYVVSEFESRWKRADPWFGELRPRTGWPAVDTVSGAQGVRTTKEEREILRELCSGRDQKGAARQLGISLRTFNAKVAKLRELFDAESVPELTFKWALSPDRHVDDSEGGTAAAGEAGLSAA